MPEPPYYAVIFTSRRTPGDRDYAAAAADMVALASTQPGFLGLESARSEEGLGITVSYWRDEASIKNWKLNATHSIIRARGRAEWYETFEVRVAKVERAYDWKK